MTRYRWLAEPPVSDPDLAQDLSLDFANQTEAEDWLGTFFSDLRHAGAARVTLLADDTPIFGPMELSPAEEAEGERS